MELLTVLFWSLVGSVFSLVGGIALIGAASKRQTIIRYALPFGAGALLAGAFISLLPEALEGGDVHSILLYALGGFLGFFVLERSIGWFHHHHHHDAHGKENKTHAWLIVIGDTLHNAIDGIALGAAFLVNPAAGIATAIAVAAHEIPQEIGDFGIMLGKGMRARQVILVNLISALATVITALGVFIIGGANGINPAPFLAIAAGFFIYVAASDIIPDIHERPRGEANRQAVMLLIGVLVLGVVSTLTPHSHEQGHEGHDHEASHMESEMHHDHYEPEELHDHAH
jgi:zinc and cadmium transporter